MENGSVIGFRKNRYELSEFPIDGKGLGQGLMKRCRCRLFVGVNRGYSLRKLRLGLHAGV